MSTEFWVIGIIKVTNKRLKNNLWVLSSESNQNDILNLNFFERANNPSLDPSNIVNKYKSIVEAEFTMEILIKQKFSRKYKFKILHYKDGKLLED